MGNLIKIAFRNLYRQKRRTLLTIAIISVGVIAVLLFSALSGAFKNMMVGQITDSMLGHMQIHRKGYVSSLDNLPLDKTIDAKQMKKMGEILDRIPRVEAYSKRILMGGMLSNYMETTNIKVAGINPKDESIVTPLLTSRIKKGEMLKKGEILLPELVTKGMNLKVGQSIVLIVNNVDGSVNGQNLKVAGIVESVVGPTGKYGYIHIDDAVTVLRMDKPEFSEIAIRLNKISSLDKVTRQISLEIVEMKNKEGEPIFEVHSWKELSPFYNIAKMIDLMSLFINILLVAIVLISILNVMIMAVYERIKEIGTLTAIGTLPGKIRTMFLMEGLFLGFFGSVAGSIIGIILIIATKFAHITIAFGRNENILIDPAIPFDQMALITLVSTIVAVLASLQPAIKASHMDPIEALRYS
ncbi:ABC transporter permease [candidate division WOR-3 bacterium]|nr:ABC transporter permease [candidate division WOR-3 bacterium]